MTTELSSDTGAGFAAATGSVVVLYPKIVFRVQDAEGRGPWRPGFSSRWVEDRDDHEHLMPWTVELGAVHRRAIIGMATGCGCLTVEQLRRWFTASEYRKLLGFGYAAVKLGGCHVLGASKTQCVFERMWPLAQAAEPIELYPPNDQRSDGGTKI